jgi:hypothetical protein
MGRRHPAPAPAHRAGRRRRQDPRLPQRRRARVHGRGGAVPDGDRRAGAPGAHGRGRVRAGRCGRAARRGGGLALQRQLLPALGPRRALAVGRELQDREPHRAQAREVRPGARQELSGARQPPVEPGRLVHQGEVDVQLRLVALGGEHGVEHVGHQLVDVQPLLAGRRELRGVELTRHPADHVLPRGQRLVELASLALLARGVFLAELVEHADRHRRPGDVELCAGL